MRLISCHIENFGKLSDYNCSFDKEINCFCEENGWGKSTLMAFLRVMFFGLQNDAKRNDIDSDRRRYRPWQGGVFGGRLEFEVHGKRYIVSRIFKDKEANDEFELRDGDTNLISNDYSSKLGEEIFKLNNDSFIRSVFITQNDCVTSATDSINAKMGNIADNTGDIDSYEKAMDILKSYLDRNSATRATGYVRKLKDEKSEVYSEINGAVSVESAMKQYEERISNNSRKLSEIRKRQNELTSKQDALLKSKNAQTVREVYKGLCEDLKDKEAVLKKAEDFFPVKVCDDESVRKFKNAVVELNRLESEKAAYELSAIQESRLSELKEHFVQTIPSEEELTTLSSNNQKLMKLMQSINENELSENEKADFDRLEKLFEGCENPSYEASDTMNAYNELMGKKPVLETKRTTLSMYQFNYKKKSNIPWLMIVGIILILSGCSALLLDNNLLWIASGVGIILFIAGIFVKPKKNDPALDNINMLSNETDELEVQINALKEKINSKLLAYNLPTDEASLFSSIQRLNSMARDYEILSQKKSSVEADERKNICKEQSEIIEKYLKQYNYVFLPGDYLDAIYKITSDAKDIRILKEKEDNYRKACEKAAEQKGRITDFLNEYGFDTSVNYVTFSDTLSMKCRELDDAITKVREAGQKKAAYEEENDTKAAMESSDENEDIDLNELADELRVLSDNEKAVLDQMSIDRNQANELSERFDRLMENRERYDELTQQISEGEKTLDLVKAAKESLEKAKEALTQEYMQPLLDGFNKYFKVVAKSEKPFMMDANAKLSLDEYGMQRDISLLSQGYRDLIGVALRASFVDAMYPTESPVLFLDDPFVNLDDMKISGAKDLLEKISKDYQVIYFTCSKSRM